MSRKDPGPKPSPITNLTSEEVIRKALVDRLTIAAPRDVYKNIALHKPPSGVNLKLHKE